MPQATPSAEPLTTIQVSPKTRDAIKRIADAEGKKIYRVADQLLNVGLSAHNTERKKKA